MIKISKKIYDEMVAHAIAEKPNEACGILGGKDGIITKHYPMTNIEKSPESYLMEPKEQFAVVKDLRAEGIEMLVIYHSHPHSPARPSAKDIDMAFYPEAAYIIISLENDLPYMRAFEIKNKTVTPVELNPKNALGKGEGHSE